LLKFPIDADKARLLNTSQAFSSEQHSEDMTSEFVAMEVLNAAKMCPGFEFNFDLIAVSILNLEQMPANHVLTVNQCQRPKMRCPDKCSTF